MSEYKSLQAGSNNFYDPALSYTGVMGLRDCLNVKPLWNNLTSKVNSFIKARSVSHRELSILYHQFATMILAGMSFRSTMRSLQYSTSTRLGNIILMVTKRIEEGATLSHAMSEFPHIFSNLDIGVVLSGEHVGELGEALERLANHHERTAYMQYEIKRILTYPVFTLTTAFIAGIFLFLYFIPTFQKAYAEMHLTLPLITKLLFTGVSWTTSIPGIISILSSLLIGIPFIISYLRTPNGILWKDMFLITCPGIKTAIKAALLANFFRTFATLMENGFPLAKALLLLIHSTGNQILREHIEEVRKDIISGYATLHDLMNHYLFPPMTKSLLTVIEETGEYSNILTKVAGMYEEELHTSMEKCVQIATPIIFLGVGIIVGSLLISIILPIYSLIVQFTH